MRDSTAISAILRDIYNNCFYLCEASQSLKLRRTNKIIINHVPRMSVIMASLKTGKVVDSKYVLLKVIGNDLYNNSNRLFTYLHKDEQSAIIRTLGRALAEEIRRA